MPGSTRWHAVAGGAIGASHLRKGQEGEDSFLASTIGIPFIAVSDGHGSDRCTRSRIGSAHAVEAVASRLSGQPSIPTIAGLVEEVIDEWRKKCADHLEHNPMSHSESEIVAMSGGIGWALLYGATLLFAAAHDGRVVGCRIGDGDILIRRELGDLDFVPELDKFVDNETDSLCVPDAGATSNYCVWDVGSNGPCMVIVASDGFGSAFEDPNWHKLVADDIHAYVESNGVEGLPGVVPDWCSGPADVGGDDASLALLLRVDSGD
jgi:hypothetical protein